jgi:hypothetical protein
MVARVDAPVVPGEQAVLFYLYCDDVPTTRDAIERAGVAVGEIAYPFYAPRGEFRVQDPDGYVLMITHTLRTRGPPMTWLLVGVVVLVVFVMLEGKRQERKCGRSQAATSCAPVFSTSSGTWSPNERSRFSRSSSSLLWR